MRVLSTLLLIGLTVGSAAQANETVDGVELPPIPTKSSKSPSSASNTPSTDAKAGQSPLVAKYRLNEAPPSDEARKPLELKVKPGFNELVTIAKGHVNRIVTPFENPIIRTSSNVEIAQEGSDIYVTTPPDEATVAMFILDAAGGPAISLSLLPRSAPPREIRLSIEKDPSNEKTFIPTTAPLAVESQAPYVTSVVDILTEIARGKVPSGYRLAEPSPDDHILFYCPIPASKTDLRQVVEGSKWRVGVTRVRNQSHYAIEVREGECQAEGRLATALFPSAVIQPGEEAEMYVVIQRERKVNSTRSRDYVFTR